MLRSSRRRFFQQTRRLLLLFAGAVSNRFSTDLCVRFNLLNLESFCSSGSRNNEFQKVSSKTDGYEIREVENTVKEIMEMTTPVFTRKVQSGGEKMEMTTPVITRKGKDQTQWRMSFVMPSKYGSNLPLPKDSSVKVPRKIVALFAFSDEEIERRDKELKRALQNDKNFRVKDKVSVEVAQVSTIING